MDPKHLDDSGQQNTEIEDSNKTKAELKALVRKQTDTITKKSLKISQCKERITSGRQNTHTILKGVSSLRTVLKDIGALVDDVDKEHRDCESQLKSNTYREKLREFEKLKADTEHVWAQMETSERQTLADIHCEEEQLEAEVPVQEAKVAELRTRIAERKLRDGRKVEEYGEALKRFQEELSALRVEKEQTEAVKENVCSLRVESEKERADAARDLEAQLEEQNDVLKCEDEDLERLRSEVNEQVKIEGDGVELLKQTADGSQKECLALELKIAEKQKTLFKFEGILNSITPSNEDPLQQNLPQLVHETEERFHSTKSETDALNHLTAQMKTEITSNSAFFADLQQKTSSTANRKLENIKTNLTSSVNVLEPRLRATTIAFDNLEAEHVVTEEELAEHRRLMVELKESREDSTRMGSKLQSSLAEVRLKCESRSGNIERMGAKLAAARKPVKEKAKGAVGKRRVSGPSRMVSYDSDESLDVIPAPKVFKKKK